MAEPIKLPESLESKAAEARQARRAALMMMMMVGCNILTPEELAQPVIDEANKDKEAKDAFVDAIITMENLTPSKRKALIRALAVKYLEQKDLLDLSHELSDINTATLKYSIEHEECRKKGDEALEDFQRFMREEMGGLDI